MTDPGEPAGAADTRPTTREPSLGGLGQSVDSASTGDTWRGVAVAARSRAAIDCYEQGVVALVAGLPHADVHLARAVALDAGFLLGRIGLAVVDVANGFAYRAPAPIRSATRAERQHAEIVDATLAGSDPGRATDLRREHLLEYPGDLLIVWLPVLIAGRQPR